MRLKGAKKFIKSTKFPFYKNGGKAFKYSALIGLGGNLGKTRKIFEKFIRILQDDRRFFIKESSIILQNSPFGFLEQDDFLNAVILVKTSIHAREILKIMQRYEMKFKRVRSFKNAPRTLDLDILYFSRKSRNDQRLTLPHKGVNERISVLLPLGLMKGI